MVNTKYLNRGLTKVMKVNSKQLCSLLNLGAENEQLDTNTFYTSNPFDILKIQNQQVIHKQYGIIKYLPQYRLDDQGRKEPSIASTLADLNEQDFVDLLDQDLSANTEILEDAAQKAPIVKLVNLIFREAYEKRASDIHFDPTADGVNLRFRIDGILYEQPTPPKYLYSAIISRVKILAGLNIAEKRLPQDGRIRVDIRNHPIDIRVATVPSVYGESMSLRLLDKSNRILTLKELGLSESSLDAINQVFSQTSGIVLTTGPTGSGKTTTLYAILQMIKNSERKILTLEDPVEYEIEGITQTQIRPNIGLTFATGLRSLLRHDPDVILVGEIRDKETAEMAIHASLTGHLVLSSIHTNDAPGAITRLVDMGIEPFLVTSSLRAVVAQRLVRVLCKTCKLPNHDGGFSPVGCIDCGQTGFFGRTAVTEVMVCDDQIKHAIMQGANSSQLHNSAINNSMIPMLSDAMEKVEQGITSLHEIRRVLGQVPSNEEY